MAETRTVVSLREHRIKVTSILKIKTRLCIVDEFLYEWVCPDFSPKIERILVKGGSVQIRTGDLYNVNVAL